MKYKSQLLTIAVMIIAIYSSAQITDHVGQAYKTVKIGTQEWMAENLNISHFNNGDSISEAKTIEEWEKAGTEGKPVWCYYGNNPENGKELGKLYNWYAVNDSRGIAPKGWHVPSDIEWIKLTDTLGKMETIGKNMKSTTGWNYYEGRGGNGNNSSGFTALPAGCRDDKGTFDRIGMNSFWWTTTEDDSYASNAWCRGIYYGADIVARGNNKKGYGMSVRCIRN